MKNKVKGILTPILLVVCSVLISVGSVLFIDTSTSGGWVILEVFLIVFMLTGLILVILVIIGLILYIRNKSEYGLGILIGTGLLAVFSVLMRIVINVYNSFI